MNNKYMYFTNFYEKAKTSESYDEILCLYNMIQGNVTNYNELMLINSLLDKNRFHKKIADDNFRMYIKCIDEYINKRLSIPNNDMADIIEEIRSLSDDPVQLTTINRIIRKYQLNTIKDIASDVKVKKYCPHCNRYSVQPENTSYIICGYTKKGYDWKGCGKDWCFRCNKKLCKSWDINKLYNKINRFHDKKCCKVHANRNKNSYFSDYCMCTNMYVRRE